MAYRGIITGHRLLNTGTSYKSKVQVIMTGVMLQVLNTIRTLVRGYRCRRLFRVVCIDVDCWLGPQVLITGTRCCINQVVTFN